MSASKPFPQGNAARAHRRADYDHHGARPSALPDQRAAFLELVAAKLNGQRDLGDDAIYRLYAEPLRELLMPLLETHQAAWQRNGG